MSSSEAIGAPHLPTSPSAMRMVGVVAHQRRQVECHGEPGLALLQQIVIAAIGFFRRGEAGELAHGPEPAAIHVAMNAARVRKLAWRRNLAGRGRFVEWLDFDTADGGEAAIRDPGLAHWPLF